MIQLGEGKRVLVADESDEYILVRKVELEELFSQLNNQPQWVTGMKWLSEQTGIKSPQYLKEKILYPFRDQLEEFVAYPESSGGQWRFHIKEMQKWLNKNFKKVNQ